MQYGWFSAYTCDAPACGCFKVVATSKFQRSAPSVRSQIFKTNLEFTNPTMICRLIKSKSHWHWHKISCVKFARRLAFLSPRSPTPHNGGRQLVRWSKDSDVYHINNWLFRFCRMHTRPSETQVPPMAQYTQGSWMGHSARQNRALLNVKLTK